MSSHSVGFLKLPLIFTDKVLYAGAIGQFYLLTRTLEGLDLGPLSAAIMSSLSLKKLTKGYEADLHELLGSDWEAKVEDMATPPPSDYIEMLKVADDVSLCAAIFVLYGALVIGGGKSTQKKVKGIRALRDCDHVLFDVDDDMRAARKRFKAAFNALKSENPEEFKIVVVKAKEWMTMNNAVVLSIKATPSWWPIAAAVVFATTAAGYTLWRKK